MSRPRNELDQPPFGSVNIGCPICGGDKDLAPDRVLADRITRLGRESEGATRWYWCPRCGYASGVNEYQTSAEMLADKCRPELRRFAKRSLQGLVWWPEGDPHIRLPDGAEADIRLIAINSSRLVWRRSDYGTDRPEGFIEKMFAENERPSQGHPHADYSAFAAAFKTRHETHHFLARLLPYPKIMLLAGE